MGSKKRSSWSKQKAEFSAGLSADAMDDVFAREYAHKQHAADVRGDYQRRRACDSKNRYASRAEAEENAAWCAQELGKQGLQPYECPYCGGWHLTSHPWD